MDAPVPTSTKGRRDVTNVPAQSLTMMNDPFIVSLAERLARRVRDDESLKTVEAQIAQMFQLALNRQAAVDELAGAKAFIGDAAERQKSVQSQLTALQRQIADSKAEVTAIREPVRRATLGQAQKRRPTRGGWAGADCRLGFWQGYRRSTRPIEFVAGRRCRGRRWRLVVGRKEGVRPKRAIGQIAPRKDTRGLGAVEQS